MSGVVQETFTVEADLVPRARRLARSSVGASFPELADDAELVISELVTNAALHGEPPVTVRVKLGDGVRLEVEDASRHHPVLMPADPASTTGRGLSLVAALTSRWGVENLPGRGKQIWVELDPTRPTGSVPAVPTDELIEFWAGEERPLQVVRLGPVPTDLLLQAENHIQGLARELALLREGEATSGIPLPPELAALVEPLVADFADGRRQIEQQAAAAFARGEALTDLELHLDFSAVEAGERHLGALDEADRSARSAHLLALAAPPVLRLVREWCVGTAVEQLRARRSGSPEPPVRPLASVLGEQLGRMASMADAAARLTLIEAVTAELAAAKTVSEMAAVVVDHAVQVLGVRSARVRVVTPRKTLRSVAWAGPAEGQILPADSEIDLDADVPGARVARTGQPAYVRSVRQAAGTLVGSEFPSHLSARVLPLTVDGQVLGILSLIFRTGELTDEAELSLATSLASMLARSLKAPLRSEDVQGVVLDLALTAAGVGTFDWDLVSGRLVWDRQLREIFGRSDDDELTIDDFYSGLHPADRDRLSATLEQVVETVGTYEAEYRIVLPDGRLRWVAASGRAIPGPDGSTARLLGVAQDTTERVDARDRISRVMDTWAAAFFFLDRSWTFSYVNAEADRILGRRADELLGRVIWEEFPAAVGSDFETEYRRAFETGEPVAFEAYYPEPLNAWYEVRAWPGPDGLAVYFLDITTRRRAQEAATLAISRVGLLARVTEELGTADTLTDALRTLSQLVVPSLAEWCVVTLVDDDHPLGGRRSLKKSFAWHEHPGHRRAVQHYADTRLEQMADDALLLQVAHNAEPHVINGGALGQLLAMYEPGSDAVRLIEELAPQSVAVIPIFGRHRLIGLLSVCNSAERGPFSDVDLELLRDVAARAGVTLDRARLYRQQQQVVEALQRSMLTAPPTSGPRMAVRYVPAGEVAQIGGDWYDAFDHPDGARVVVIGDVVGHDTLAAAAMGQVRTLLRTVVARHGRSPAAALSEAEAVMSVLGMETLATVVVGRIEDIGGSRCRLVMANAGHPPPMLLLSDGTVRDLVTVPADPILGIGIHSRHDNVVDLPPGSTLVIYTDGLVERRDRDFEDGQRKLAEVLKSHATADVEELCDAVLFAMVGNSAEDDVALMGVRLGEHR